MDNWDIRNAISEIELKVSKVNSLFRAIEGNYFNFDKADWSIKNSREWMNAYTLCCHYDTYSNLLHIAHDLTFELEKELAMLQEGIDIRQPIQRNTERGGDYGGQS